MPGAVYLKDFDPSQPRDEGGQWTSGGGSGQSGGGGPSGGGADHSSHKIAFNADIGSDEVETLKGEISDWEGGAREIADEALEAAAARGGTFWTSRDADGQLTGVLRAKDNTESGMVEVSRLAARPGTKGSGTALMKQAFQRAAAQNMGINLYSTKSAVGFYKRLAPSHFDGLMGKRQFTWSAERVKELVG